MLPSLSWSKAMTSEDSKGVVLGYEGPGTSFKELKNHFKLSDCLCKGSVPWLPVVTCVWYYCQKWLLNITVITLASYLITVYCTFLLQSFNYFIIIFWVIGYVSSVRRYDEQRLKAMKLEQQRRATQTDACPNLVNFLFAVPLVTNPGW